MDFSWASNSRAAGSISSCPSCANFSISASCLAMRSAPSRTCLWACSRGDSPAGCQFVDAPTSAFIRPFVAGWQRWRKACFQPLSLCLVPMYCHSSPSCSMTGSGNVLHARRSSGSPSSRQTTLAESVAEGTKKPVRVLTSGAPRSRPTGRAGSRREPGFPPSAARVDTTPLCRRAECCSTRT